MEAAVARTGGYWTPRHKNTLPRHGVNRDGASRWAIEEFTFGARWVTRGATTSVNQWAIEELNLGPHAYQDPANAHEMCVDVSTSPHWTNILLSFASPTAQVAHTVEHPAWANGHHA